MSVRRKGNRWEVRVRIGGGARVERTLPPGASRADALELEAAIRRRQIETAAGRQPSRLIDEALDEWVATSASNLKSWQSSLRYRVDVIREYTRGRHLEELPLVAQSVRKGGLETGAKAATINRYLSILRRVGNLAERWGWTNSPLGRRVEMMGGEQARHVYLTERQVRKIADAAGGECGDAIMFAALTGLRRGELLRLRPEMIVNRCIVLDANTKSGKPRVVPMPPQAARIAAKRLPWRLTLDELRNAFEAARAAAGLAHVQFRDLRHTYASWLAQDGANLANIRDLLGHSSLAVTSRYSHLAPEHLRKAVSKLKVSR